MEEEPEPTRPSPLGDRLTRVLRYTVRHPLTTLGCLLAFTLAGGLVLAGGLRHDFGIEQLLPRGDAEFARYQELSETFGRDDNTVFVFVQDDHLFTPGGAADMLALSNGLEDSPLVEEVVGFANATLIRDEGEAVYIGPVLNDERLKTIDLDGLRVHLTKHPVYAGRVVAADGRAAGFAVRIDDVYYDDMYRGQVMAHVNEVLSRFEAPGRVFLLTGSPTTRSAYLQFLRQDAAVFVGLVGLLLALALWLTFRNLLGTVLPLLTVLLSLFFTLVYMQVAGIPLNMLSSAIPVLVLIVGISDSIHLLTRYGEELATGQSKEAALERAVLVTAHACLLTSITTATGFFVLMTTGIPILADLGLSIGAGILIAYVVSLSLIPAVATLAPQPRPRARPEGADDAGLLDRVGTWVMQHPRRTTLACLAGVVLVAAGGAPGLRVESRVLDDLPDEHPVIRTRTAVEDSMGGNFSISIVVHPHNPAGVENPADDPALLDAVAAFQREVQAGPEAEILSRTLSATDYLEMVWREFGGEGLPTTEAGVQQALLLVEGTGVLERHFDENHRILRLDLRVLDRGTHATFAFLDHVQRVFEKTVGDLARLEVQGTTYMVQRVHRDIVWNAMTSFLLDFFIVAILVFLLFKSLRLTILAIIPNLLPLVCTVGFMGIVGIDLRISSAIVFSIVFGIAVDDTVHFLARYHEERKAGLSPAAAAARTITTTGRAMAFMSFVLATGLSVLLLSAFNPNRVLGLLMVVTVASGMLGDLVLLPALLVLGDRSQPT